MAKQIFFEENEAAAEAAAPQPLVSSGAPIRLRWPTDYRVITQGFGGNPELYVDRGLPGHEGVDIRAPLNSKVYACADGTVDLVQQNDAVHGTWMRIQHADGYSTVYAQLAKTSVGKGQRVQAGQVIGIAGDSGSSSGGHLHLGLAQAGATANQLTHYPNDIIDPTPFLPFAEPAGRVVYPWPADRCLAGVNYRGGGLAAVHAAEAVRVNSNTDADEIARLRAAKPALFLLTKLEAAGGGLKAEEWVARVRPTIKRHNEIGVGYFEIHSTPNLSTHGYGSAWRSGEEFAGWWLDVYAQLKASFPLARFGFPALANGDGLAGVRADAATFLQEADEAALAADWLGAQCYWSNWRQIEESNPMERLRQWHPDKLIFVSEFGSLNSLLDEAAKRQEHDHYLAMLQTQPGIGAAFRTA
jgi:hypothetical protein